MKASAVVANGRIRKVASPRVKATLRAVTGVQLAEVLGFNTSKHPNVEDSTLFSSHKPVFINESDIFEPIRLEHLREDTDLQRPEEETVRGEKYLLKPWTWPAFATDPAVNCYGQPIQSIIKAVRRETMKTTRTGSMQDEKTMTSSEVRVGGKRTQRMAVETTKEDDDIIPPPTHKKQRLSIKLTSTPIPCNETAADAPKDVNTPKEAHVPQELNTPKDTNIKEVNALKDSKQKEGAAGTMKRQKKPRRNEKNLNLTSKGVSVTILHPDLLPRDIVRHRFNNLRGGTLLAMCNQVSDNGVKRPVRQIVTWCEELRPSRHVTEALFRKARGFTLEAEDADEEGKPPRGNRCARRRIACSTRNSNASASCNACTQAGCAADCAMFDYQPRSKARQNRLGRA